METMYELCSQRYDDDGHPFTHSFLVVVPLVVPLKRQRCAEGGKRCS